MDDGASLDEVKRRAYSSDDASAVEPDIVTSNCVPRVEFITSGIRLDTGLFASTRTEYFTVPWDPTEGPHFENETR